MFKETGGNRWLLFLCLLVAEIQISVQPQPQQAAVGSRVLLTCRAFGPPDLNYQWFRGKEEVRLLPLFLLFQCFWVRPHIFAINVLYGWLHPQISGEKGSSPELILCPLAPVHQGHYICRINNGIKCIFSQWARISVIHSAGISSWSSSSFPHIMQCVIIHPATPDCSSSLLQGSVSGLFITSHPQSQMLSEGDTLFLECNTLANPPAQYRWYHNMVPMEKEKSRLLQVSGLLNSCNA